MDRKKANRLINHGPVVMVTSGGAKNPNIITIAWSMPVSKTPPLLAISIGKTRHSHRLIDEGGEFVICVPSSAMLDHIWTCGVTTGSRVDKFKETGLTPKPSRVVATPGIEECIANLECKVVGKAAGGDHTIFIGEVMKAEVEENLLDEEGTLIPEKASTIHHLGSNRFALSGKKLVKLK